MRRLAHPFRISAGRAVTVEQEDDPHTAQRIGALIATIRGERALVPAFGVPDPTFGRLDLADIAAGIALFGPAVTIDKIGISYPTPISERVLVSWSAA